MAYGADTTNIPPPSVPGHVIIEGLADQIAEKTGKAVVKAGEKALQHAGERAKRSFIGLSVDSFRVPTFIKDKIKSIGNSKTWKSLKQYCVRTNESWGTIARWGMGGALTGGYLFGSTVGAAFGMGVGSAIGLYFATSTWSNVGKQLDQAEQDAEKLKRYQVLHGDINLNEPDNV
ncbi:hypothetical protein [Endozoicomonas numazuensis]|uniref:Uncharacterized protein n=1 Tax=Endozoicomonas numazuensis TaxID=1137799 RepID=A0A081NLH8_9GAMM|nr:hypothetical protein [Endozoicomonas numazuensis]KEQ19301.1 hypothetical protein GZ78_04800 [Endozoicomonas numazuensis]